MDFGLVSEINPSIPHSFLKPFLTFDIDWASDAVLEYCIDILEQANVRVTWFATHQTPLLDRIRENPYFELGIHPNFNPLLEGNFCYGNHYAKVLEYYLNIVPEAKVMRSHSLGVSSRILMEAKVMGITHDCNLCIPIVAGGGGLIARFVNWDKLIRCPYHWADDIACMYEDKIDICSIRGDDYFMFGFHPIHIFLNTASLEQYENAKPFMKDTQKLREKCGHSLNGAKSVLERLLG